VGLASSMAGAELRYRGATELGALMRRRELSPMELVTSMLRAVEETEPFLTAFVTVCADEALAAAREAEAALVRGAHEDGRPLGPLHGLPVLVKDLIRTAGVRTTFGSRTHDSNVPRDDALPVARLKRAGAIVLGKTTTPEFGFKTLTDAPISGITRNPWDPARTPGGSSGGTAAAIAAGIGPLGLGTDGGGSIRIPSAACGIVGLKPTLGRVAYPEADDGFLNMSHYGPMTRSVADARLMLAALAGPDPADPLSHMLAAGEQLVAEEPPPERLDGLRLGWLPRVGEHPLDAEVERSVASLVGAFEALGAVVTPLELDLVGEEATFVTILRSALWARSQHLLEAHRDAISDDFARSIALGAEIGARDLHSALQRRTELFRRVQRLFERVEVLVMPTLTTVAVPVSQGHFEPVTIAGVTHPSLRTGWHPYAFFANLTGHPAISVPSGWSTEGLPIGAQLVGRLGAEGVLLRLAARWEAVRPWDHRRPRIGTHH
jgi:aspartyl-tRNA(Asn)/glutamyl-tRNA(Gln) amidotransferase subunit A